MMRWLGMLALGAVSFACRGDRAATTSSNGWDASALRGFAMWERPKKQRDEAGARRLFADACEHGSQLGCAGLGALDLSAGHDLEHAIELLSRACTAHVGRACASLASAYESGLGVKRDGVKAVSIARDSCTKGEHRACVLLARAMLFGDHGLPKDINGSRDLAVAACDANIASGCTLAGLVYSHGVGDARQAQQWLTKACDAGDGPGCAALAVQYLRGGLPGEAQGATVSAQRGVELAARACDLDAVIGCSLLAKALANGEGIPQDVARASELAHRACNDADAAGCAIASQLAHADGREEESIRLRARSCELGNAVACRGQAN